MDFKLVSKNNVGVVALLLLVILLSQSKFFNFLLDNALGRAVLITFLIFISYANKILGIVTVLLIIIMFNNSNFGYMEGFDTPTVPAAPETPAAPAAPAAPETPSVPVTPSVPSVADITTPVPSPSPDPVPQPVPEKKDAKKAVAAEGFDVLGTERTMQKGKQSNSIPVNSFMRDSESALPFENSKFTDIFSAF